jgi:peptidoglycan pentaglycine glycine transferase (the first glycine)
MIDSSTTLIPMAHATEILEIPARQEWDGLIDALSGSLLQSWDWGEFKRRHGWEPIRLAIVNAGGPAIASQVLFRPIGPFSVAYVPRGPAGWDSASPAAVATLSLALEEVAAKRRAGILFLEPDVARAEPLPTSGNLSFAPSSVELQPLRTIKVRLDRPDDDLLASMKSKTRYNVRLAMRRGVHVRVASLDEITTFYELLEETSGRDAFGIHEIDYYADLLDVFAGRSALLIAEIEGDPAAAIIVLAHGDEAIYMFGASGRRHQRHMPTHLIQFEAMRWARERGCTTYDLWGIPADDEPPPEATDGNDSLNIRSGLWGVYRFKQGFGGEIVTYPGVYERVYYPGLVRLWRLFRPQIG